MPFDWLRLCTAALLVLQMAIAFSPLVERQSVQRGAAHTHDQQRRHRQVHDESTCAICSARQQVAEASDPPAAAVAAASPPPPVVRSRVEAPARAPRGDHPSRAPPVTA